MRTELTVEQRVIGVISNTLGMPSGKIHLASTVKDLDIDSLDMVEILVELEEEFGSNISDDEVREFTKVLDLYNLICHKCLLRDPLVKTESSELLPDETYTIKLDSDSMNEAVVKFLVQCYRDNQKFREDDGIQDSILDVLKYCSTESEYDSILTELGIE